MYNHKEPWENILFQFSKTLQNQAKCMLNAIISLTLLSRMKLTTFIKWTSLLSSSGLLGVFFNSYSNFDRTSCKQTVGNLIRHCSLWRLILACIICLCPTKRTQVWYGLNTFVVYVIYISCIVSSSKWIMIGYRAILTIWIGMAFAICGTETVTIKTVFAMARINVCFNVSLFRFQPIL